MITPDDRIPDLMRVDEEIPQWSGSGHLLESRFQYIPDNATLEGSSRVTTSYSPVALTGREEDPFEPFDREHFARTGVVRPLRHIGG